MQSAPERRPGKKVNPGWSPGPKVLEFQCPEPGSGKLRGTIASSGFIENPLDQHSQSMDEVRTSNKGFCAQQTWKLQTKPVALLQDFSGPLKWKYALLFFKRGYSISHPQNVLDHGSAFSECLTGACSGEYSLQVQTLDPERTVIYLKSHNKLMSVCFVTQLCPTLCDPMDCSPPGSSVHGDSIDKNTGVGCHALLQGIFPTQGLNPGLLHCRWILYYLSHQGSPS